MLDFFAIAPDSEPWHGERIFYLKDPTTTNVPAFSCNVGGAYGLSDVNAIVRRSGDELRFAPIDFNDEYKKETSPSQLRCDGMLYSKSRETVVFVEMKDRNLKSRNIQRWKRKGVLQLAAVVRQFKQCHPNEDAFTNGEHAAYVSNQRSPYVVEYASTNDKMSFLMDADTRGFQLYIKKDIKLENVK